MATKDPRVDAYIRNAAEFAQPLLRHFREQVHAACPAAVETIKWGMPQFTYHGNLCGMAAFKQHCAFNFWKRSLLFPKKDAKQRDAMGQFGRVTTLRDMPPPVTLRKLIREAARLNEEGVRPARARKARAALAEPPDLLQGLKKHPAARKTWEGFAPSHRREYIEWLTEAKRDDTRARRLATTLEWLAEGKQRNWKYQR
ncbi:MAG TPA: YdeI/OmpD-associated family protein [Gemmatimonadales bacterium]|jgi:uncharacterized protein YdeI (YjbR/CyaY-like superfamily)|nr:YdeI/OmpD-associated family protein [Gemmatimonadales bacterium]